MKKNNIMKQKATLTTVEQQLAWSFAEIIEGEDANCVRKDFLGAYIHRNDYNKNTDFGWCVEYILDQNFLNEHSTTHANIFCRANVRVLFIKNHLQNINNPIGEFYDYYEYDDNYKCNRFQEIRQQSNITQEGIDELKQTYGLSDEVISMRISNHNFYEPTIEHNI